MDFKVINFQKTEKVIMNEFYGGKLTVCDYWQYYVTGIESIVNDQDFILTDRYDNERSEVIAYNFYDNESLSDVIILSNNDNFLFDAPVDYDLGIDIVDNRMKYLQSMNKTTYSQDEYLYWEQKMKDRINDEHKIKSNVIIPKRGSVQKIIRNMNSYMESREVH